jgi:hypothetical protein
MGQEQREIVRVTSDCQEGLEEAVGVLREAVQNLRADRKTRVVALAEIVKEVLDNTDSPEGSK